MLLEMRFLSHDILLLVIRAAHVAMGAAMIVAREGRTVEVSAVHSDAGIEWLATRRASDPQHEASHEVSARAGGWVVGGALGDRDICAAPHLTPSFTPDGRGEPRRGGKLEETCRVDPEHLCGLDDRHDIFAHLHQATQRSHERSSATGLEKKKSAAVRPLE